MNQAWFQEVFNELTERQQEVLAKFLAGETDAEIAAALFISQATVRQHIKAVCDAFATPKRGNLKVLFARYKPDLVGNNGDETIPIETTPKPAEFEPSFVGREGAVAYLNTIVKRGEKVILIQAAGGVGKTTLAQEYLKTQGFEVILELLMAKEKENITTVESVVEEWLKKDFQEEPGREFLISLGRLKRQLQTRRVGILIDNLEPALDKQGRFIETHRKYVELLRVLTDSTVKSLTLITSREKLCESGIAVELYRLPALDEQAWQQFFSRRIQVDITVLKAMHKAYGGNAKAMGILCGEIREEFAGDMGAYWHENESDLLVERDLEDLVTSQFNRLELLYPDAYKLLCRLGCYRYQDVPTVPTEGLLCLLWDVVEAQPKRVIDALRNRSLVEFNKGEYWLHPVIRAEAIARLRRTEDWEIANHKAAEFWTESVKTVEAVEDALKAFEAYYHYCNIDEFNLAAEVILTPRRNRFYQKGTGEYLSNSFDRIGLSNELELNINAIIGKIDSEFNLAILNQVLGVQYYFLGEINKAIEYNEKSIKKMEQCLKNNIIGDDLKRRLRLNITSAQISISLCKLSLCNFKEAFDYLEEAISTCTENKFDFQVKAFGSLLAFLYSCPECLNIEKSKHLADTIYKERLERKKETTSRGKAYMLFFLGGTYKNIGDFEKADEIYKEAIEYFDDSRYTQFKGRVLTNQAELCREQGNFETALDRHTESIELLDKIGAKCDLAEAHFQLALTYQKMGDREKSQPNFQTAIRLFTEMEAPKQVERVQQAINSDN